MQTKRFVLNISLIIMLCLTLAGGVLGYFMWKALAQTVATSIPGFLVLALLTLIIFGLFLALVLVELSVYFNLRYLLLCEEKTPHRTLRNVAMLILAGVSLLFGAIGLLLDTAFSSTAAALCTCAFTLMLLLRAVDFLAIKLGQPAHGIREYR